MGGLDYVGGRRLNVGAWALSLRIKRTPSTYTSCGLWPENLVSGERKKATYSSRSPSAIRDGHRSGVGRFRRSAGQVDGAREPSWRALTRKRTLWFGESRSQL